MITLNYIDKLSRKEEEEITSSFDKELIKGCYALSDYNHISVSVVDHWLSKEEWIKEPIAYSYNLNKRELKKYLEYESRILNFYSFISNHFKCYIILDIEAAFFLNVNIIKLSEKKYNDYIFQQIRNEYEALTIIPQLKIILRVQSESTHGIYYKDSSYLPELEKIVKQHDLFIIRE